MLAAHPGLAGTVVAGGASRAESVRRGLIEVGTEFVLVHDAARPLADADLFDAIVARLVSEPTASAVIAAAPLTDTVKRALGPHGADRPGEPGEVAETMAREQLWAAQTPQGFRSAALRRAQEQAADAGELDRATDEARLIELAGGRVLLEPAPAYNLKVTGPDDLLAAAALLAALGRV